MRNEGNKFVVTMVAVMSNFSNRSANNGEQATKFWLELFWKATVTLLFLTAVVVREKVKDSLPTIDRCRESDSSKQCSQISNCWLQ